MNKDIAHCPGRFESAEHGPVTHKQCLGCQRRSMGWVAGYWYLKEVPVFINDECPMRKENAHE